MKNDVEFSIKDFTEKLALFEGSVKNSKNTKEEKDSNMNKKISQDNKKLSFDSKTNKFLIQNDVSKGQMDNIKLNPKHVDQLILENVKLKYNHQNISQNNAGRKSSGSINNDNSNNSQGDEIKYINKYIREITNRGNVHNMNQSYNPKKLNLKEIFRKMNIEQIASNVNEEKRKELMKFALAKKEEEKNYEKKIDFSTNKTKKESNEFEIKKENVINYHEDYIEPNNSKLEKNKKEEIMKEEIYKEEIKKDEIKKEEKETKNENSNDTNFLSSLNDLYNKKLININNNKTIKKLDKSKIRIFDSVKSTSNTNTETKTEVAQSLYMNDDQNVFLQGKNISNSNNTDKTDKFCECFFLASFPKESSKIIPNSESLPSDCGHEVCSSLPAMEPDILYKYPDDINSLEVNSLAASICFPNGIKLCYEEDEEKINVAKNYRSTLTNQGGQMFFIFTYHFYLKMENEVFINVYKMHPIRYQLTTYQDEFCQVFSDEVEEDIVKKLGIYSDLNFKEYVYIPFCFGLISKYPFYPQIKSCLESIFNGFKNVESDPNKIYNLITFIIRSIPVPPNNSRVTFPLPYINRICEINYPYYQDIFLFGNDPMIILEHFSINNIIAFMKLLLFEQKIIVVGKDMDIVSQVILNFLSLLYPFEWIHTYIPVMSIKMLKFLQSFLPFFNGMNITLYNMARSILAKSDDVFIINVDDDTIDISNNLRKKDKNKANNYINKNFATLPKGIENVLIKDLKLIKIELEKYRNYNIFDKQVINNRIKNIFFQMFIEILYDYDKYTYIVDDYPVFNTFSLINDKQKADKKFYEELTSTQLFQMFIQKSLLNGESSFYFDEKIKEHKELYQKGLNSQEIYKNIENEFLSSQKINKNYIIKPYLFSNYIEYEEKMKKENKSITLADIKEFIFSQQFNIQENEKRKNKLIIDKLIKLNNKNDLSAYKIFLIPSDLTPKKARKSVDENSAEIPTRRKRRSTKIRIIAGQVENEYKCPLIINNDVSELNEEQKEEITDNIKDVMKKVFKSSFDDIKEDKELLMNSVKTKFGIGYFVNIISSGNKKNISIKILENESFDFLYYIILGVLLDILKLGENDDILILALKLTKACLFIKTIKNKKEISLSDEVFSKLEDYSIYKNKIFWQKWIEDEMTEDEVDIYKVLKKGNAGNDIKNNDKYKLYTNHSFEIIDKLFGIMIKLKLPNFFIYSTYSELSREYIFEEELFDKLIKEMINGLEYYQKLSKK